MKFIVLVVCFYVAAATPISYNKAPAAVQTHAAPVEKKAPVTSTYKAPAAPSYKARVAPSKASVYKAPAVHAAPLRKYKRSVLNYKTLLTAAYKTPAAYKVVKSPAYLPHRAPIVVLY
jgi:hypothetical protein